MVLSRKLNNTIDNEPLVLNVPRLAWDGDVRKTVFGTHEGQIGAASSAEWCSQHEHQIRGPGPSRGTAREAAAGAVGSKRESLIKSSNDGK
jgi:hypothetical protein